MYDSCDRKNMDSFIHIKKIRLVKATLMFDSCGEISILL